MWCVLCCVVLCVLCSDPLGSSDVLAQAAALLAQQAQMQAAPSLAASDAEVRDSVAELLVRKDATTEVSCGWCLIPLFDMCTSNSGETKTLRGKEGLFMLEGKEGSSVNIKCDKDVNVLSVTATLKK